jgi:hypothetical protein
MYVIASPTFMPPPCGQVCGAVLPSGAAVGALGASGDSEDDDHGIGVVDDVDDAKITDPQAPEVGPSELRDPGRSRLDGEGEDRSAEPAGLLV